MMLNAKELMWIAAALLIVIGFAVLQFFKGQEEETEEAEQQSLGSSESEQAEDTTSSFPFPFVINGRNVPHIGSMVMAHLDTDTLLTARKVCSSWQQAVDSETTLWSEMSLEKALRENRIDIAQMIVKSCRKKLDPPSGVALINVVGTKIGRMMGNVLSSAASLGREEFVSLILDNISDKNPHDTKVKSHQCKYSGTPLHIAAICGQKEVCRIILDQVDDKNPANLFGVTPLHAAAFCGQKEVCQMILDQVDDKNPRDELGATPLHEAAMFDHSDVCLLLLDCGADPNTVDNLGWTALHYAVRGPREREKTCRVLLERMTDKNPPDAHGETPLDVAKRMSTGYTNKVVQLIQAKLEE